MTDLEFLEGGAGGLAKGVVYSYVTGLFKPDVINKIRDMGVTLAAPEMPNLKRSLQRKSLFGTQTFLIDLDVLESESKKWKEKFLETFDIVGTSEQRNNWIFFIRQGDKVHKKLETESVFQSALNRMTLFVESGLDDRTFDKTFNFLCVQNRGLLAGAQILNWEELYNSCKNYVKQSQCDIRQLNGLLAVVLCTCVDIEAGRFDPVRFKSLYKFKEQSDYFVLFKLMGSYLKDLISSKRAMLIRELALRIEDGMAPKAVMVMLFNMVMDFELVNAQLGADSNKPPEGWNYFKFNKLRFFNQIQATTLLKLNLLLMREDKRLCTSSTFLPDLDKLFGTLEKV